MDLSDMWPCGLWPLCRSSCIQVSQKVSEQIHFCQLLIVRHYEATQHAFAMQLGSQRVWNYLGGLDTDLSMSICI